MILWKGGAGRRGRLGIARDVAPSHQGCPSTVRLLQVGWALGPDTLLKHLRTVHQNSVYHCPTQAQVRAGERGQASGGDPWAQGPA